MASETAVRVLRYQRQMGLFVEYLWLELVGFA